MQFLTQSMNFVTRKYKIIWSIESSIYEQKIFFGELNLIRYVHKLHVAFGNLENEIKMMGSVGVSLHPKTFDNLTQPKSICVNSFYRLRMPATCPDL